MERVQLQIMVLASSAADNGISKFSCR